MFMSHTLVRNNAPFPLVLPPLIIALALGAAALAYGGGGVSPGSSVTRLTMAIPQSAVRQSGAWTHGYNFKEHKPQLRALRLAPIAHDNAPKAPIRATTTLASVGHRYGTVCLCLFRLLLPLLNVFASATPSERTSQCCLIALCYKGGSLLGWRFDWFLCQASTPFSPPSQASAAVARLSLGAPVMFFAMAFALGSRRWRLRYL